LGLGRSIHDRVQFRLWKHIGMTGRCVSDLVLLPRPAFFFPGIPLPLFEMGGVVILV
jgi:hypothetical protein